jgi:hypothetical protein
MKKEAMCRTQYGFFNKDMEEANLLGRCSIVSCDRRHGFAHIAHPFQGDQRPVTQAVSVVRVKVLDVLSCKDGYYPGKSLCLVYIDRLD